MYKSPIVFECLVQLTSTLVHLEAMYSRGSLGFTVLEPQ